MHTARLLTISQDALWWGVPTWEVYLPEVYLPRGVPARGRGYLPREVYLLRGCTCQGTPPPVDRQTPVKT